VRRLLEKQRRDEHGETSSELLNRTADDWRSSGLDSFLQKSSGDPARRAYLNEKKSGGERTLHPACRDIWEDQDEDPGNANQEPRHCG
jgi:hypothetical protein